MKRALLFIDSLGSGGSQRQLVNLAKMLKDRKYSVKVVTYYDYPFFEEVLINNSIEFEILSQTKKKIRRIILFRSVLREFRPQIIISYLDTPNVIAILGSLFNKHCKLLVSERSTTRDIGLRDRIKFFLYRFADTIIVNSRSQFIFITDNYPNLKKKSVMISNSVDLKKFNIISKKTNLNGNWEIGVLARLDINKNAIGLVHAVHILLSKGHDIRIKWHGNKNNYEGQNSGRDSYYLNVVREIKILGIEDRFLLFDPLKDVENFYHCIDALCLPSFNEGFPNVIAEAIACGKPILASDFGDIKLMVKNGLNGFLFNPHSIDSIVNAFERFCALSENEINRMRQESRKIAKRLLSENIYIEKYLSVIG